MGIRSFLYGRQNTRSSKRIQLQRRDRRPLHSYNRGPKSCFTTGATRQSRAVQLASCCSSAPGAWRRYWDVRLASGSTKLSLSITSPLAPNSRYRSRHRFRRFGPISAFAPLAHERNSGNVVAKLPAGRAEVLIHSGSVRAVGGRAFRIRSVLDACGDQRPFHSSCT